MAQANPQLVAAPAVKQNILEIPSPTPATDTQVKKNGIADVVQFVLRPFQEICIFVVLLLLVTTHTAVVWLMFDCGFRAAGTEDIRDCENRALF